MKLYTKSGDRGETSLIYGRRVKKDDARVEAYGSIDEANAVIGVAVACIQSESGGQDAAAGDNRQALIEVCRHVQRDLFDLGRDLATPEDKRERHYVTPAHTEGLERVIDRLSEAVPPLTRFVLPGGSLAAAYLHQARTVVRRAERRVVQLAGVQDTPPEVARYLNRLSDLLFAMARAMNQLSLMEEPTVDFNAPAEPLS